MAASALNGICGKLERANENIRNLHVEIEAFLDNGAYRTISYDNGESFVEIAAKLHASREIPLRFGVLAGEIVHHLRSCLDHIAWGLSNESERGSHPGRIEFPIFDREPKTPEEIPRYERKIKGISDDIARTCIQRVQPYRSKNPHSDPLWIIHEMDRTDKHRELVIVFGAFNLAIGPDLAKFITSKNQTELTEENILYFHHAMKVETKLTTQIAFREFGDRQIQAVIPGLAQLAKHTEKIVSIFRQHFE